MMMRKREVCDAWVEVDELEHHPSVCALFYSLCCASSLPSPNCQVACPGQMIFFLLQHCCSEHTTNAFSDNLVCRVQSLCACYDSLKMNDESKPEEILQPAPWDLICKLWRTFCHCACTALLWVCLCVLSFVQCTCCKITGKWSI